MKIKEVRKYLTHGDQLRVSKAIGCTPQAVGMYVRGDTNGNPLMHQYLEKLAKKNKQKLEAFE